MLRISKLPTYGLPHIEHSVKQSHVIAMHNKAYNMHQRRSRNIAQLMPMRQRGSFRANAVYLVQRHAAFFKIKPYRRNAHHPAAAFAVIYRFRHGAAFFRRKRGHARYSRRTAAEKPLLVHKPRAAFFCIHGKAFTLRFEPILITQFNAARKVSRHCMRRRIQQAIRSKKGHLRIVRYLCNAIRKLIFRNAAFAVAAEYHSFGKEFNRVSQRIACRAAYKASPVFINALHTLYKPLHKSFESIVVFLRPVSAAIRAAEKQTLVYKLTPERSLIAKRVQRVYK